MQRETSEQLKQRVPPLPAEPLLSLSRLQTRPERSGLGTWLGMFSLVTLVDETHTVLLSNNGDLSLGNRGGAPLVYQIRRYRDRIDWVSHATRLAR